MARLSKAQRQLAAQLRDRMTNRGAHAIKVGELVWSYKRYMGTSRVTRIDGDTVHLENGTSMHFTNVRRADAEVAP